MKISIAQLNFLIGDFEGNTEKILAAAKEAKADKADIICFPELSICGYPPRDFLEFDDFIKQAEKSIKRIAKSAKGKQWAQGVYEKARPGYHPLAQGTVDAILLN